MKTTTIKKAGGIVFNQEGKLLVVLRKHINDLTLPKGHLENNENLENCAIREVEEETGYKCKIISFIGIMEYNFIKNNQKITSQVHFYEMIPTSYNDKKLIQTEIKEILRINLNKRDINKLTHESDKKFILTYCL